jgi:ABC-2 type transport system permease protein
MFISLHPEQARDLGLLGAKAQLAMLEPTWPAWFGMLAQITSVGGIMIFGMPVIWTFGREFSEHTAKDLLALPVSRTAIVAAKFATTALWSLLLSLYLVAAGAGVGVLLGIPGQLTWPVAGRGTAAVLGTAVLTIAITQVFGLAASWGRGYLPAIGVLFAVVFTAQIMAALGYGTWFPFSVPALHAGIAGQMLPSAAGYAGVAVVAIAAVTATAWWWQHADHTR